MNFRRILWAESTLELPIPPISQGLNTQLRAVLRASCNQGVSIYICPALFRAKEKAPVSEAVGPKKSSLTLDHWRASGRSLSR
jgi:phosphoenolpyruvate-protein kinase (PTS system EI component)